jgi:hypothetical protein
MYTLYINKDGNLCTKRVFFNEGRIELKSYVKSSKHVLFVCCEELLCCGGGGPHFFGPPSFLANILPILLLHYSLLYPTTTNQPHPLG